MIVFIHGHNSDCLIWALEQQKEDLISTFPGVASPKQPRGRAVQRTVETSRLVDWTFKSGQPSLTSKRLWSLPLSSHSKRGKCVVTFSNYSLRGRESEKALSQHTLAHIHTNSSLNTSFSTQREGRGHSRKVNSNFGCFIAFANKFCRYLLVCSSLTAHQIKHSSDFHL